MHVFFNTYQIVAIPIENSCPWHIRRGGIESAWQNEERPDVRLPQLRADQRRRSARGVSVREGTYLHGAEGRTDRRAVSNRTQPHPGGVLRQSEPRSWMG